MLPPSLMVFFPLISYLAKSLKGLLASVRSARFLFWLLFKTHCVQVVWDNEWGSPVTRVSKSPIVILKRNKTKFHREPCHPSFSAILFGVHGQSLSCLSNTKSKMQCNNFSLISFEENKSFEIPGKQERARKPWFWLWITTSNKHNQATKKLVNLWIPIWC